MMTGEWGAISGVIQRGHAVASGKAPNSPYPNGALEMQIPHFQERGLDLASFYRGTLNVSINPHTFTMKKPEHTFRNIKWTSEHPAEDFSFSRCSVVFEGRRYAGWIYYPHPETKKRHFQDPSVIEIIAPFIPGLGYGDRVEIEVQLEEVSLIAEVKGEW